MILFSQNEAYYINTISKINFFFAELYLSSNNLIIFLLLNIDNNVTNIQIVNNI